MDRSDFLRTPTSNNFLIDAAGIAVSKVVVLKNDLLELGLPTSSE